MSKTKLVLVLILMSIGCNEQEHEINKVVKNEMSVLWYFENSIIHFEMKAPTKGWITIGFNTNSEMTGAYLLMGNVINKKVNLVEHYTSSPGDYSSISNLGAKPQAENIKGMEEDNMTTIAFSFPTESYSKYQKELHEGKEYVMIIAYSQEDDFQHHSSMRTSFNVKL